MVLPDDFVEALGYLPPDERDRAVLAAVRYAMTGEEPDLDGAAMGMFLAAKRSISKANRQSRGGARGGSAPRAGRGDGPDPGQGDGTNLGQGSAAKLEQGSGAEPCGEHNITEQNLTEPNVGGARPRAGAEVIPFGLGVETPCPTPTLDEVRSYFATSCLRGDPDAFFWRYDEVGWVDAQGRPIVNWHSTALRWSRREPTFEHARAERERARAARRGEAPAGEAWRPAKSARQVLAEIEAAEGGEGVAL